MNRLLGAVRATVENENADAGRWYHYNERKVPGLWECDTTDTACMYEAEMAYIRNREVDRQSKSRKARCIMYRVPKRFF